MFKNNLLLRLGILFLAFSPTFLQAQNADLELTMTANNPQVGIYDYITITTTIDNTGGQTVDNAIVKFDIPTGVAIAGEFPPNAEQGSFEGFFGGSTEGNWFVGELAAGQSLTFEVTFFTLSENSTTFYGQVSEGANNDQDSTPGNGTCCTANEDDEAAYSFPNDGPGCTFDQAYAELVCDDNNTPDDTNDDAYSLRFRADGTTGEYSILINTLSYFQTFEYSTGFVELPLFSLEVETLELIFSDVENTEGCGEMIILDVPACAETDCEIVYNEISNTIDDMGTPDNLFDDTFTIVYTIENAGGGTGFVGLFGGQFCGQVPSVGTYGEEITFTANVANWGNGAPVGCQIVDNENPDCTGGYTLLPAVDCGFGNACADLELTAANTPTPDIFSSANAQFTLENDFLGEDATGIQISFNKSGLNVVGVPVVSQGTIDLYWTDNPVWNVGDLGSNQTATIDFDLYTVAANYSLFGEVSMQNEDDFDSTPNNGNGLSPQEDDEAIYQNGGSQDLPDLVPSNLLIQNSPVNVNEDLAYTFDVTNIGTTPSGPAAQIRAWISTDNVLSPDDIAGGGTSTEAFLPAGGVTSYTGTASSIPNDLPDGNYFIIIQLDEFDVILESNETNNTIAAPFTIGSDVTCDLTIVDTQITCAENTSDSPFVFAVEVAGAAGNTVDYEILGTSFSGTIITNQLVDVATLPQGTDFTILVSDPNNVACDYVLTSNIPSAPGVCGDGGGGADVTLSVSNSQNTPTGIYQAGEAIFTLTNTGTSPATGLTVTFSKNQVNVTGTPTTTQGTAQSHWTANPIWNVGTLAPGQSELIVFPVFTVGETFGLYGEVTAMNEADNDSTPNNGNGNTPTEDDEALWPNSDNPPVELPDLVIANTTLTINSTEIGGTIDYSFTIENQGDAPNMSDFVFTGFVTDDATISTPYSGQGTELVTDVILPGQSITRSGTFTINANVPSGYNYFGIIVDGGGNIPESNEDNNAYLDGLFFFDEANNPCMIDLELVNINCTAAEGVYDLTIAMNAVNLFPINQTYTVLNGEFLGVAFSGDSDVRTFFDIPLDQVTMITTTDSSSDCIDDSLIIELDPDTDCDVVSQGVDLELSVTASAAAVPIYSTYSLTYTLTNAGNEEATGVIIKSPRNFAVVYEGGNEFTASQGSFDFLGANNSFWNVGSLAAGATATLTVNFFTIDTGSVTNWAYVITQNEPDFDSTPNEWICCVPVEDDEAGIIVSVTQNLIGDNPSAFISSQFSVNAYPVPAQDYLTVELNAMSQNAASIEILDVNGRTQIVQETETVKGLQTVQIPVADLEKGIYLLSVRNGGETVVQRFVKM